MDQSYHVITIAGNGDKGFNDGNAVDATFNNPAGICLSDDGRLYVADSSNHRIRMIYNNKVTTFAGNGEKGFKDGNTLEAMFAHPWELCTQDRRLYVSDTYNHKIRMVYNRQVSTIAGNGLEGYRDGNAHLAMFSHPRGLCISKDGKIYVADQLNNRIRMIHDNQVSTVAGNGQKGFKDGNALNAMFYSPCGICISNFDRLYVTDRINQKIRLIYNNQVVTIAGNGEKGFRDGNAQDSILYSPYGICMSNDKILSVVDQFNDAIRIIYYNQVTTIAGNRERGYKDGNGQNAMFDLPAGICISEDGVLYVTDGGNQRIRMITDTRLQKSPFGFSLLLDVLCDSQISFNDINYHIHSTLVNVRCPSFFDKSYYSLILQSNISNKSFESFLTFLYSNKLTKEQNEIWPANMTIKNIVELIFVFDVMMNCKWIVQDLITRFRKQLIEILNKNEQECVKELIVDVLPYVYRLQEISKTKPSKTTTIILSYTEHAYNIFVKEMQNRQIILREHLTDLEIIKVRTECFESVIEQLVSEPTEMQPFDDESMIVFGVELIELSKLAFAKTNIDKKNHNTETQVQSSISTQHLDKWTTPDFVIKLPNDDISYHVHKLILCGRWKYFCQMIESGLKEAIENEMTLSDDWNKSRFEKMMKYIYLNEIEFESVEDVKWLMENRKLYGITLESAIEAKSHEESHHIIPQNPGTQDDQPGHKEVGSYGFKALFDHCISMLDQKL